QEEKKRGGCRARYRTSAGACRHSKLSQSHHIPLVWAWRSLFTFQWLDLPIRAASIYLFLLPPPPPSFFLLLCSLSSISLFLFLTISLSLSLFPLSLSLCLSLSIFPLSLSLSLSLSLTFSLSWLSLLGDGISLGLSHHSYFV